MDVQSGKNTLKRSSLQSFTMENYNLRDNVLPRTKQGDDEGEYSGRPKNQTHDSVDDIIKKYKHEKFKYNNQNLNKKMGEHGLFKKKTELTRSIHSFYNYVEPKYFTTSRNKDHHDSEIDSNVRKPNRILTENIGNKVTFKEENNINHNNYFEQTSLTSREKFYADKTTYCRPVASLYNEEFIYKTMERNSRLKRLVKNFAIARQREKENVNWNNFINDLKNKPSASRNDSQRSNQPHRDPENYITPDIIDDYYNTRFSCQQSRPCSNLLQDLYEGYDVPPQPTYYYPDRRPCEGKTQFFSNRYAFPYSTNSYCYPTASQGRLIMLERERQRNEYLNQWRNRFSNNNFRYAHNNHINKNYDDGHFAKKQDMTNSFTLHDNKNMLKTLIESATVQTDNYFKENIFKNKATYKTENAVIDAFIQTIETNKKTEEKTPQDQDTGTTWTDNMKTNSLVNIENKLETLIDCINNFIEEIKLNKCSKRKTKAASVICGLNNITNKKVHTTQSDSVDKVKRPEPDQLLCGETIDASSESTIETSNFYPCMVPKPSKIDEILKEIDKLCSKDRLFRSQPCSVNITFEVPTRDCSTEVTKSLSKQETADKVETIEEISTPEHTPLQQMTIAVNTDPFNFLSLLRISTEALMRLLSNVPNINYHSYLSLLPFPQTSRKVESHFICNICGAAFNKPSALSDHIQEHNLGETRDCCVCRHVLDLSRRPARLFRCKFCGQRFTRAYCRELHQRGCARRLGLTHDVDSGLMLLR